MLNIMYSILFNYMGIFIQKTTHFFSVIILDVSSTAYCWCNLTASETNFAMLTKRSFFENQILYFDCILLYK